MGRRPGRDRTIALEKRGRHMEISTRPHLGLRIILVGKDEMVSCEMERASQGSARLAAQHIRDLQSTNQGGFSVLIRLHGEVPWVFE